MHFLLNGSEVAASSFLAPGQASGWFDLGPVTPGSYTLGFDAEGEVGGCNSGNILSWGGTVDIVTTFAPFQITSITPTNANDLLITWNTTGISNIVQIAAGADASGSFSTNGFTDLTNIAVTTTTTNFWDVGAANNMPARYYRIRSPQ